MKVAIYNKASHIMTVGGGEKVMAEMILALKNKCDLTLITDDKVDLSLYKDKFDLDITDVKLEILPSEMQLSEYTKNFDIFLSASHNISNLYGQAKKNFIYISFPKKILLKTLVLNKFLNSIFRNFFNLFLKNQIVFELAGKFTQVEEKFLKAFKILKYSIEGNTKVIFRNQSIKFVYLIFDKNLNKETVNSELIIFSSKKEIKYSVIENTVEVNLDGLRSEFIELDLKLKDKKLFDGANLIAVRKDKFIKSRESRLTIIAKNFTRLLSFRDFIYSYENLLCNSKFTQKWTKVYWGREAEVVYPPSEIKVVGDPSKNKRENKIITIGRFFEDEHNKKHIPMILAFRKLIDDKKLPDWELHMCGGSMPQENNQKYLRKVKYLAQGYPIFIHEDIAFNDLTKLLSKSKIFWHASGIAEDENINPIKMEHFGIVPVEAMCSGVVPVLINKAGMKETVEHNKSGYLWNNLDELQEYTFTLAQDEELLDEMRKNALDRAKKFNTESFTREIQRIILGNAN